MTDEELVTKKVIPCLNEMYREAESVFNFIVDFEMIGAYAPVINGERKSVMGAFYLPKEKYEKILKSYTKGLETKWVFPYGHEDYKKGEEFEYKKYLENLEEKKIMNDKYPLIEFIYYWNNKGKTKTEEEIKNTLKSYNTAEKAIKDKRTNKLITKLIARPSQISRYFPTQTNEVRALMKIAQKHKEMRYNEM